MIYIQRVRNTTKHFLYSSLGLRICLVLVSVLQQLNAQKQTKMRWPEETAAEVFDQRHCQNILKRNVTLDFFLYTGQSKNCLACRLLFKQFAYPFSAASVLKKQQASTAPAETTIITGKLLSWHTSTTANRNPMSAQEFAGEWAKVSKQKNIADGYDQLRYTLAYLICS